MDETEENFRAYTNEDISDQELRKKIGFGLSNLSRAITVHFQNGIDGCSRQFPKALYPKTSAGKRKA